MATRRCIIKWEGGFVASPGLNNTPIYRSKSGVLVLGRYGLSKWCFGFLIGQLFLRMTSRRLKLTFCGWYASILRSLVPGQTFYTRYCIFFFLQGSVFKTKFLSKEPESLDLCLRPWHGLPQWHDTIPCCWYCPDQWWCMVSLLVETKFLAMRREIDTLKNI